MSLHIPWSRRDFVRHIGAGAFAAGLGLRPKNADAAVTAAQLSFAALGAVYPVTQAYLNLWQGNPTPDHRHAGIDFGAPRVPVRAVLSGLVLTAGNAVGTVAIFDGVATQIYLHMDNIRVRVGDRIQFGTGIGTVGMVGANAVHLHLEVRRGKQPLAVGQNSVGATANLTFNPLQYF
jgi:murein DD-endopeptidase MepM/ murein hydrolase activator NlpD